MHTESAFQSLLNTMWSVTVYLEECISYYREKKNAFP
jgi:hypothetical protein